MRGTCDEGIAQRNRSTGHPSDYYYATMFTLYPNRVFEFKLGFRPNPKNICRNRKKIFTLIYNVLAKINSTFSRKGLSGFSPFSLDVLRIRFDFGNIYSTKFNYVLEN